MLRDVSRSVRVKGEKTVILSLLLDAGTGLALGSGMAADRPSAVSHAVGGALTTAVGPLEPRMPDLVLCAGARVDEVEKALTSLRPDDPMPPVRDAGSVPEAEEVFDSLLGHLIGRSQPEDPPTPGDWRRAFELALDYCNQAPWERWSNAVHLRLELRAPGDGEPTDYVGVVLGAEGIQLGLGLCPGSELPAAVGEWEAGKPVPPLPSGTLMIFLDPPPELPPDLLAKAVRYGWSPDAEVVPAFVRSGPRGPLDVSRRDLHHLSLAAAAVVAHDRRGPILVGPDSGTTGELTLAGGSTGRYSLKVSSPGATPATPVHRGPGARAPAHGPSPADADGPTIDVLFGAFLADQRSRLGARTFRNYESVIELFSHCLNGYGYESLDAEERRRWEAVYAKDEEAFVHLFGADKITENLGEFLGYFMLRKVAAGPDLLRASGTVTKKLARWLADGGYLDPADAREATKVATAAARDLPRAEKLSNLLYDQSLRCSVDVRAVDDSDYVEDYLTIDRVEPGRLWFEGGIGPVKVSKAASDLAQPGWSLTIGLARTGTGWQVVEAGNVYP